MSMYVYIHILVTEPTKYENLNTIPTLATPTKKPLKINV